MLFYAFQKYLQLESSEPSSLEIAFVEASGGKRESGEIRLVSTAVYCWVTVGRSHQTVWDGVA